MYYSTTTALVRGVTICGSRVSEVYDRTDLTFVRLVTMVEGLACMVGDHLYVDTAFRRIIAVCPAIRPGRRRFSGGWFAFGRGLRTIARTYFSVAGFSGVPLFRGVVSTFFETSYLRGGSSMYAVVLCRPPCQIACTGLNWTEEADWDVWDVAWEERV